MLPPLFVYNILNEAGIDFFCGVPDSTLKSFIALISDICPKENHVICANEGSAVGLAIGYHLATGKNALIYLQNSGLGNSINPLISLADSAVYSIPVVMMIGWRGEPGIKDEPQHLKQGRITLSLLDALEIPYIILSPEYDLAKEAIFQIIQQAKDYNRPVAIIIKPDIFEPYPIAISAFNNSFTCSREDALKAIVDSLDENDLIVSSTGMISRELYEIREIKGGNHNKDFLTIGGMGHAASIALGLAMHSSHRIVCLDGDGALIMHMGLLTTIGTSACKNIIHIVLNNGVHGSVGGQPTASFKIDFTIIAQAVGYSTTRATTTQEGIKNAMLSYAMAPGPHFLEVKLNQVFRNNLGRPQGTPRENKIQFMENI